MHETGLSLGFVGQVPPLILGGPVLTGRVPGSSSVPTSAAERFLH